MIYPKGMALLAFNRSNATNAVTSYGLLRLSSWLMCATMAVKADFMDNDILRTFVMNSTPRTSSEPNAYRLSIAQKDPLGRRAMLSGSLKFSCFVHFQLIYLEFPQVLFCLPLTIPPSI